MVLKKVYEYLDSVKMKKVVVGGFEEECVYQTIEKICGLYEEELAAKREAAKENGEKLTQLQEQCAELREKLENVQQQLQEKATALESYRIDNSRLTQMVSSWTTVKEDLTQNAQREIEQMRAQAEQSAAQLRLEAEQEAAQTRLQARQAAQQIRSDAESERSKTREELAALEQARANIYRGFQEIQRFCKETLDAVQSLCQ